MAKFIAKYNETGSLMHRPGSGRPSKITLEMKEIVEAKMREDEAAAYQLHTLLVLNQFRISVRTVLAGLSVAVLTANSFEKETR